MVVGGFGRCTTAAQLGSACRLGFGHGADPVGGFWFATRFAVGQSASHPRHQA